MNSSPRAENACEDEVTTSWSQHLTIRQQVGAAPDNFGCILHHSSSERAPRSADGHARLIGEALLGHGICWHTTSNPRVLSVLDFPLPVLVNAPTGKELCT